MICNWQGIPARQKFGRDEEEEEFIPETYFQDLKLKKRKNVKVRLQEIIQFKNSIRENCNEYSDVPIKKTDNYIFREKCNVTRNIYDNKSNKSSFAK